MTVFDRRTFIQSAGLVTAGGFIAGCSGNLSGGDAGGAGNKAGTLTWWDHSPNLEKIDKQIFAEFAKRSDGAPVKYTQQQTSKMGQTLQLAKQSKQLPDITTSAGLGLPLASLVEAGWFQPMELSADAMKRLKGYLYEGFHLLDGKLYTFPLFHVRTHNTATWFNTELAGKAGLDPAVPPKTFDEFRAAAHKMQDATGGRGNGWICNIGMSDRFSAQVDELAQCSGFAGSNGQLFRTGEYRFHDDTYLTVVDFLTSLKTDKLMAPASTTMDDKAARAKFATGNIGYYLDGPWCAGVINENLKPFAPRLGGGGLLVAQQGQKPSVYVGPSGGMYYITADATNPALVSRLLSMATTDEYYRGIASGMARPPLELTAIDKAQVLDPYKKVVESFQTEVFLSPQALLKNPAVTKVLASLKQVKPGLGEIVQGVFSGDVSDVRAELTKLSDASNRALDAAITAAKGKGAKVSRADFAFADWQPLQDYALDKYPK